MSNVKIAAILDIIENFSLELGTVFDYIHTFTL